MPHLDELSADAAALQAVNTVVFEDGRVVGHNTDTTGFAESFARGLEDASLDHVVLLGAGGAGTAVGHAALRLGARRLTVVDIDRERAVSCAPSSTPTARAREPRRPGRRRRADPRDPGRHGRPSGAAARRGPAPPRPVGRGGRLPAARDAAAAARARTRLPDARRRRHGRVPGRRIVRAVHRRQARSRADAAALRRARRPDAVEAGDAPLDRDRLPERHARGEARRRGASRIRRRRAVRERPDRLPARPGEVRGRGRAPRPADRPLPAVPRLRGRSRADLRAQPAARRGQVRRDGAARRAD